MTVRPIDAECDNRAAARTVIYVANAMSGEILTFGCDPNTATLELIQHLEVGQSVGPMTVDRDGRVLFACLRGTPPCIASFAVAPGGRLRTIGTTPVGTPFVYLRTDRSGRFLFGASYTGAAFAIYPIDERGRVGEPTQTTPTPPHAHCIITDPTNASLVVTSLGADVILQYRFAPASGRATPNDPPFIATPKGSGPRHLIFHPNGAVAYVNGELDGSIGVYTFDDRTGRLREIQRVSIMPAGARAEPWGGDLQISPDGAYVYASDRRTSTLAIFAVRPGSGLLDARGTVETEHQPRSIALDPSGRFLFVAGEKSNHLASYAIDAATGAPELRARVRVGEKPGWLTVMNLAATV
jgi:6-phosphogluconolactonase